MPLVESNHPFSARFNPCISLGPSCNHDVNVFLRLLVLTDVVRQKLAKYLEEPHDSDSASEETDDFPLDALKSACAEMTNAVIEHEFYCSAYPSKEQPKLQELMRAMTKSHAALLEEIARARACGKSFTELEIAAKTLHRLVSPTNKCSHKGFPEIVSYLTKEPTYYSSHSFANLHLFNVQNLAFDDSNKYNEMAREMDFLKAELCRKDAENTKLKKQRDTARLKAIVEHGKALAASLDLGNDIEDQSGGLFSDDSASESEFDEDEEEDEETENESYLDTEEDVLNTATHEYSIHQNKFLRQGLGTKQIPGDVVGYSGNTGSPEQTIATELEEDEISPVVVALQTQVQAIEALLKNVAFVSTAGAATVQHLRGVLDRCREACAVFAEEVDEAALIKWVGMLQRAVTKAVTDNFDAVQLRFGSQVAEARPIEPEIIWKALPFNARVDLWDKIVR